MYCRNSMGALQKDGPSVVTREQGSDTGRH